MPCIRGPRPPGTRPAGEILNRARSYEARIPQVSPAAAPRPRSRRAFVLPSRNGFTAASSWSSRSLPRNNSAILPRPMRFSTLNRLPSTAPAMSSPREGYTVHPSRAAQLTRGPPGARYPTADLGRVA